MPALVKLPDVAIPLVLNAPMPSLGMLTTSWKWPLSKTLQDWSASQLHYPLGTIIHDVVDGHPIVAQIQVHDRYGAHPERGIVPHKGTSIFVPAEKTATGKLVAIDTPPDGWAQSDTPTVAGEFGGLIKGFNFGTFMGNAVKSAGKAIGSASHALDKATGDIGRAIQKVPVIGGAVVGIAGFATTPFRVAEEIGRGKRVDRVLLTSLKNQVEDVKQVAPLAESVISFVPGIGPLASGSIAAGLTLASGRPIDEVAAGFVKGAVPGGALASTAYSMGKAAMQHKPNPGAVNQALGRTTAKPMGALEERLGRTIPAPAKTAIHNGLAAARTIANGQPLDQKTLQSAIQALPTPRMQRRVRTAQNLASPENVADALLESGLDAIPDLAKSERTSLKNGLQIGMSVGHAQHLQALTEEGLDSAEARMSLKQAAAVATSKDTTLQAARASLKEGLHGFDVATGMMQHVVTPFQLSHVRSGLNGVDKKGFDLALALHIGRVAGPPAPITLPPRIRAAYHITHGMRGAPVENKIGMMKVIAATPLGKAGAEAAIKEIGHAKLSWWTRLLEWLGLEKSHDASFGAEGDITYDVLVLANGVGAHTYQWAMAGPVSGRTQQEAANQAGRMYFRAVSVAKPLPLPGAPDAFTANGAVFRLDH